MKQDDLIEVNIAAYGNSGEGIAKCDDTTVFVKNALVGENVRAKVTFAKKNVAYADAVEILSPSSERRTPVCKVFSRCGGCQLQHMSYSEQLRFKQISVGNTLKKVGGIEVKVPSVVPSGREFSYRNKLSVPVGEKNGKTVFGFYAENSHAIVPCAECALQDEWAKRVLECVGEYMAECRVSAYDERAHKGVMRHVVARYVGEQLLVCLVINAESVPNIKVLERKLGKYFDKFGISQSINRERTNAIFGRKTQRLAGIEHIEGKQFGVDFYLRPESFYQVNEEIKNKIYTAVKDKLESGRTEVLIDAFSGVGILSGALYSDSYDTFAIEIEPAANRDAEDMKKRNNLSRLTNICGDVEVELPKVVEKNRGKRISLIVDPPRKGLSPSTVQTIKNAPVENLIYISCDPATLARDLKLLTAPSPAEANESAAGISALAHTTETASVYTAQTTADGSFPYGSELSSALVQSIEAAPSAPAQISETVAQTVADSSLYGSELSANSAQPAEAAPNGSTAPAISPFEIISLQPFDMFPQTTHVETLVILSHKIPDSHIAVKVDFDDKIDDISKDNIETVVRKGIF